MTEKHPIQLFDKFSVGYVTMETTETGGAPYPVQNPEVVENARFASFRPELRALHDAWQAAARALELLFCSESLRCTALPGVGVLRNASALSPVILASCGV